MCIRDRKLPGNLTELLGNPPLIPSKAKLICINGSDEEINLNRSADELLLSDPGAFLDALTEDFLPSAWALDKDWLKKNIDARTEWIKKTVDDLDHETNQQNWSGGVIHPLKLSLIHISEPTRPY